MYSWHGTFPLRPIEAWMGSAGCYYGHDQSEFQVFSGVDIPKRITPITGPSAQIFLRWRVEQITKKPEKLSVYARRLNPDIVISAYDSRLVKVKPNFLFSLRWSLPSLIHRK